MVSGRPILAAVGLFFGGLIVGSLPGGRQDGTAHAARSGPPAAPNASPSNESRRARGPITSELQAESSSRQRESSSDVDQPAWSVPASGSDGSCALRPRRSPHVGPRSGDFPVDDPLAGLAMPDLPIPRSPHVLKYIRYFSESHEGRRAFVEALRRSGRFQEIISKAFREVSVPQGLLAVAFIESGFSTEAVSPAGAAGLWQFMPSTGRAYGLAVESTIDERASIWRSTDAAAHHLSDLYARLRSWELALAAYNLGLDGLERRLDEFDTDDFWALVAAPGALPKETAHYVPKVLAAAVVFANLEQYGFADVERAPALDASELEVSGGTKLTVVARAAGTSLRLLRELNPELLADVVPDRTAPATIHVPRRGLARAQVMLPKLASEGDERTPRVSEDFDWGKDDVRAGRWRLERASGPATSERGIGRRRRRGDAKAAHAAQSTGDTNDAPAQGKSKRAENAERPKIAAKGEREESSRVLYRVIAGDAIQQIAVTVGLTLDQLLAQAHVTSAVDIKVGTLLDLRVPAPAALP